MRHWWSVIFPVRAPAQRFTPGFVNALAAASHEARRLKHNFVGTGNILVGLIEQQDGIAAKVLFSMGVDLAKVKHESEKITGLGSEPIDEDPPLTPRAKLVLELAELEAHQLKSISIDTEHLLLGLIREAEGGVGPRILENLDIDRNEMRFRVLHFIREIDS